MSIELAILKLFCDKREIEITHYGYVDDTKNMERELKILFDLVHNYYAEYETNAINKEELLNFYDLKFPKAKDRLMCIELINTCFLMDIQEDLIKSFLDQFVEKHISTKIINKLIPVMEGSNFGILNDVHEDLELYRDILFNPPDKLVIPKPCLLSISDLIDQEIMDEGLEWHLPTLNKIIGGLRMKRLGLFYAYVDVGKTSFAMASAAHFARQLIGSDENICYAGNEEDAPRLKMRLIQAILNLMHHEIIENKDTLEEKLIESGINHIHIFDNITTGEQIQYIIKEYQPSILYVDQATDVEVQTKRKREGVDYFKSLFKWYRKLTVTHNMAILGIGQGVGTAENTKWLKLSDIYGSRVAIQGSLDFSIGLGRIIDDPTVDDIRYVNIAKNKSEESDGRFAVHFDKQRCLWRGV